MTPIVVKAYKTGVEIPDFPPVPHYDTAAEQIGTLEARWLHEKASHPPPASESGYRFGVAIFSKFARIIAAVLLFIGFEMACQILQVYFMGRVILFLQETATGTPSVSLTTAYLFAMALFLSTIL